MKILVIYHDEKAINYNKILIINALKRNVEYLKDNSIDIEFLEIVELQEFLQTFDVTKYKSYIFWLHQKIGSFILTMPVFMTAIRRNNIKTIFWMDDLHFPCENSDNSDRLVKDKIDEDERFKNCTLIFSPSVDYFKNIESRLIYKSKFLFYFFDENFINEYNPSVTFSKRTNKILLSGKINELSYPNRKQMFTNYYYNNDIFDYLEHPGYKKEKHNIIHKDYYDKLSSYKGAIVGLAKFPVNFLLAKIIEVLGCGCLGFFEKSPLYEERLGLKEYIHYIPVDIDNEGKVSFLNFEYKYIIDSKEGQEIAQNGYDYVKKNFNSVSFIKNVINNL